MRYIMAQADPGEASIVASMSRDDLHTVKYECFYEELDEYDKE